MPEDTTKAKAKAKPLPEPATVEEYDSEENCAVSGTQVQAHSSARRKGQPYPYAASDSGYSSRTGGSSTKDATVVAPAESRTALHVSNATKPGSSKTATKAKLVIFQRADSVRDTTSATVSNITAKRSDAHSDATRRAEDRTGNRSTDRRYTLPRRDAQAQAPNRQQRQYDQTLPPPARPQRSNSTTQRSQSTHGYLPGIPMTYSANSQPGPPPAISAYYPHYGSQYAQQASVYNMTTPATAYVGHAPSSPVRTMQPTQSTPVTTYPGYPGFSGGLSARQGNASVPGLEQQSRSLPPAGGIPRPAVSARRQTRPGMYVDADSTETGSESSDYDSEEERRVRYEERRRSQQKRLSYRERSSSGDGGRATTVIHDSRRPAMNRSSRTDTAVPTRRRSGRESLSRPESLYRATSDPVYDYYSSSENFDSDRTARAVVDRRSITSSQPSRRPSVSTNASRGTKATSLSSNTDYVEAVVEDKYGRRRVYLSKAEEAAYRERYERQKALTRLEEQRLQEERITDYQNQTDRGYEREHLTAEAVKKSNRKSMSHASASQSQKSGGSSGSRLSKTGGGGGGLRIEAGGNTLFLEGGQELQVREDSGGITTLIIGSTTSGKDSAYHGSKSSGSRMGRSRTSRRKREEEEYVDGYEKGV